MPSKMMAVDRRERRDAGLEPAAGGPGRIALHGGPLDRKAFAALLPEFVDGPALALAAWSGGRRHNRVRREAAARGLPFALFDCGLLRAPPWPGRAVPVLSITATSLSGPHSAADILAPARLLRARGWETPELLVRAAAARRELATQRVGGAWWRANGLPAGEGLALVAGDGTADAGILRSMLDAALSESEPKRIVLLDGDEPLLSEAKRRGCAVVAGPVAPWDAIEQAARIYTPGGEIGFLGLLAGREVHCFGNPYYAGWGVTSDAPNVTKKPFRRSIDEIFAAACLVATRCLDPYRNTAASFEETLALLADWRKIELANRRIAVCAGMSFWKRRRIAEFLRSTAPPPVFRRTANGALAAARARRGGTVAAWAARMPAGLAEAAAAQGIGLVRVEDGFVRSVGLGSDFLPAASLVFDSLGLYCDPRRPSDLELLLRQTEFAPGLLERARLLIDRLVARGVTKYNLGPVTADIAAPPGKKCILVPGQVEDDLSVLLGGAEIRGNLDLLRRVRSANPDDFVLYKPHPDVEAGHRRGAIPDRAAQRFADRIVRGVSTAGLFATIDELHTLTSLAGFEALLRRRRVVVYGRPFYAGWGLTSDLAAVDRGRRLSLEELVAGTLILYPRYLDPATRLPCPPEIVVDRLDVPELWRPGALAAVRRIQGMLLRRWRSGRPLPAPTTPVRRPRHLHRSAG